MISTASRGSGGVQQISILFSKIQRKAGLNISKNRPHRLWIPPKLFCERMTPKYKNTQGNRIPLCTIGIKNIVTYSQHKIRLA